MLDGLQVSATATTLTEDSSSAVTYSGSGWQHNSGSYAQASNADSATQTTPVTPRRSVSWVAEPGANKGEADVSIDGSFVTRVDLYGLSGSDWFRSVVFRKSWPTSATHTISIVGKHDIPSTDNYITLDAFSVG